ncbi:coiled-coil domain-containing protein 150-like [Clytia hemisphaerica]|uniref:Uncharacterized protein n=1 Tax=Clytia hemisphaerica TaxID=252671 RepID=A0A7M5X3Y8_9CNID
MIQNDGLTKSSLSHVQLITELESKNETLRRTVDVSSVESRKLKEALKVTVTDKNALMKEKKDASNEKQVQHDMELEQQKKLLETLKDNCNAQLEIWKKKVEDAENQKLSFKNQINNLMIKVNEDEFKMKMFEQNQISKSNYLESMLSSEKKMKEDLMKKLSGLEHDRNTMTEKFESILNENRTLSNRFESQTQKIAELENANLQQKEKLSWMNIEQESSSLVKKKMTDMIQEKKQLAYERGILQTNVKQLKDKNHELQTCLAQNDDTNKELTQSISYLKKEVAIYKDFEEKLQRKESEFRSLKADFEKKEEVLQELLSRYKKLDADHISLKEDHIKQTNEFKSSENKLKREVEKLKSNLKSNHNERNNVSETLKQLLTSNKQLQSELEEVQEALGKKDFEIQTLTSERELHIKNIKGMAKDLDGMAKNLDQVENDYCSKINILEKNILEEKKRICALSTDKKDLEKQLQSKEELINNVSQSKENYITSIREEKEKQEMLLKETHKTELSKIRKTMAIMREDFAKKKEEFDHRLSFMDELSQRVKDLKAEKQIYMKKNHEQASKLESFVEQVSELQNELSTIIEEHNETIREKDELYLEEKQKRKNIESRYKNVLNRQQRKDGGVKSLFSTTEESNNLVDHHPRQSAVLEYQKLIDGEDTRMRDIQHKFEDLHRKKRNGFR